MSKISGWRTSPWIQFLFLPNQDKPPLDTGAFEIWIQLCISVFQIQYSFRTLIRLERCIQLNWSHSIFVVLQIKSLRAVLYSKFRFQVISTQREVGQGQFLTTKGKLNNSDKTASYFLLLHFPTIRFRWMTCWKPDKKHNLQKSSVLKI